MSLFYQSRFSLLAFSCFSAVNAALYVTRPLTSTVCSAGESCTIQWVDDGNTPLLAAMGSANIALYTGDQQAVQQIASLDVSDSHSVTFTPDPRAGPSSSAYYIGFSSTEPDNNGTNWLAFSPWFRLEGIQGSFDSPLPEATSTKAFSSAPHSGPTSDVSISVPEPPSTSGFSTSVTSSPTASPTPTSPGGGGSDESPDSSDSEGAATRSFGMGSSVGLLCFAISLLLAL